MRQFLWTWMATNANKWLLETADINSTVLDSVRQRKLKYFGHIMTEKAWLFDKRKFADQF